MQRLRLERVSQILDGEGLGLLGDCDAVAIDSRLVERDALFVAIKGERVDGHDFVQQAKNNGAVACIVERFVDVDLPQIKVNDSVSALADLAEYYRQQIDLFVVAITGSNGKTTTKALMGEVLAMHYPTLITQGNFNNHIGLPLTLFSHQKQSHAVIEMGANHIGEIDNLARIANPDIGLITNIGPAHLEGFGDLDGVFQGKTELYKHLAKDQFGVFNADTHGAEHLMNNTKDYHLKTFGQHPGADFQISELNVSRHGCAQFLIRNDGLNYPVKLNVLGAHNAWNAAAVFAVSRLMNLSAEQSLQVINQYQGIKGRLQIKTAINNACVIDDTYNANVASFEAAIKLLSHFEGERILVMGEMGELGEDELSLHASVGEMAKRYGLEYVLAVGEKARYAVDAFGRGGQTYTNQSELIVDLKKRVHSDSTLLIKGSRSALMENIVNALTDANKNGGGVQQC